MAERFDAVVVGAGPAGCAAALTLARNGAQVLVLERGRFAGAKNVTGGILYGQTDTPLNLDALVPTFEKEAPLERSISRYVMHNLHGDEVHSVDLTGLHAHRTKWSYSVLRAKFDRWFAECTHREARRHGGGVLAGVRATGPLMDGDRIVGVTCDELDPIKADVVIAADGATSELVRKAGLRDWYAEAEWFQGVKVVVQMEKAALEERFRLRGNEGEAHLYAGDLFDGVRGGGFLYTNDDTLSIGTVFHLDSLADKRVEPAALLDRLLLHPLLRNLIGPDYRELEYSAKLIPDGKKACLRTPWKGRLLAVGDAAGQMWASGPIIKGMNLGISAGMLAAQAYLEAREAGKVESVGERYGAKLRASYIEDALFGHRGARAVLGALSKVAQPVVATPLGPLALRAGFLKRMLEGMFNDPAKAEVAPDTELAYVTLPAALAAAHGKRVTSDVKYALPSLDERIAKLTYDTAIGAPHIELTDDTFVASSRAVHTCPVSSAKSARGCYRLEVAGMKQGREIQRVALDTQPCIECGTCAVMAATKWEHPPGGKGVEYRYG